MERRHFLHSLGLSFLGLSGACLFQRPIHSEPKKRHYPWIVIYWMPYDNDLSKHGQPILGMLAEGTKNSDALVLAQADFWKSRNMFRYEIEKGDIKAESISDIHDSSDALAFTRYLDWAKNNYSSDHWAVIIVGHGGKIDQVSPDEHGRHDKQSWMNVSQIAQALEDFPASNPKKLDFLFFQNCNKATLEVFYEVRNCAEYTLASQFPLGAPNYYYQNFLESLRDKDIDGRTAALSIIQGETTDMYDTLTLINNSQLDYLPLYINNFTKAVQSPSIKNSQAFNDIIFYTYFGEEYCDLLSFLEYQVASEENPAESLNLLQDFVRDRLIEEVDISGLMTSPSDQDEIIVNAKYSSDTTEYLQQFCGIGLFFPTSQSEITKYQNLDLYQDTDLISLFQKTIPSA